jgi:tetratricopeptide (TPR) repeat protein
VVFATRLNIGYPWALAAAVMVAGCSSPPTKAPEQAPANVSLQEYSQQAAKATADGSREKARDIYRAAAKAYPASQQPWLKLAEDYFEAADYGNAVLAAQEVLLRDSTDSVAASILAVSGLRVSAAALQTLRSQNRIAGGTRSEAQTMARTLREVLGETVLVPQPPSPPASAPAALAVKPKPRPLSVPAPLRPGPLEVKPAPPTSTSSNPFDKLK